MFSEYSGVALAFVLQNAGSKGCKERNSGTFTCQTAAPLFLPSCHPASTGESLEAGTYAIQHTWSLLQLVALKHVWSQAQNVAKNRRWAHVWSHLLHNVYLHVWEATLVSFHTCTKVWIRREISREECTHVVRFIHLLNSRQVAPKFHLTEKCHFSKKQKIFKENTFPKLFIYFLPHAHTILAVFICRIRADIQDF